EHDGKAERVAPHDRQRVVERRARREARRRNVVTLHERLCECFTRLETRRGGRWTEETESSRGKSIGDAEAQRKLRPDDREIDRFSRRERGDCIEVGEVDGCGTRDARDSWIARRAQDVPCSGLRQQTSDQRVLARAAAENENPHGMNELAWGTISLTSTGFAPRIRRYVC